MKRTALKKPSDYPQFAFRLQESEKKWLQQEVRTISELRNERKEEGEPLERGNDVALEAMKIGLSVLRKKL